MPPRSTRSKKRAGADAPPEIPAPTPPACSVPPPTSTAGDPLYGFLAKVPSPVTLPSSYYTSAKTGAPSPAAQPVAVRTPTPRDDPYAFLEKVPSLVTLPQLPPSHHGEGYTMPTRTASSRSGPAVSPAPLASPARSNPAFGLTAAVPSTVSLPALQPVQGSRGVHINLFLAFPLTILKSILTIYGGLRHPHAMRVRGSQCQTRRLLPPHVYVFDFIIRFHYED
jgi:hypothetical protein